MKLMSGISLDMSGLQLSPIQIEEVALSNFSSDFQYLSGALKDAKVRFEVKVNLNWAIKFNVTFLDEVVFSVDDSGSFGLFDYDTGFIGVDAVEVPAGRMNIDIPKLALKFNADDLVIPTSPSSGNGGNIAADNMELDTIKMEEAAIPTSTPALFGATIPLQNPFGPQEGSISNTNIKEFRANGIVLPQFRLNNIEMKSVILDKVVSDNFSVQGSTSQDSPVTDLLGIVKLWASINVTSTIKADEVEFSNLSGDIHASTASMSGMVMDFKIKDISIKNIKVEGLDAEQLGVGL